MCNANVRCIKQCYRRTECTGTVDRIYLKIKRQQTAHSATQHTGVTTALSLSRCDSVPTHVIPLSPSAKQGRARPEEVTAVLRDAAEACYTKFNPNRSTCRHSYGQRVLENIHSGKLQLYLSRLSLNILFLDNFFFVKNAFPESRACPTHGVFRTTSRTDGQTRSPLKAFPFFT